jgi:predicted lipid-binding transport protein (Tim44 family)
MNSPLLQLLVLAGIAVFLILRLRSVLGTRDGFEKSSVPGAEQPARAAQRRPEFEVIEGGPDEDITDHVPQGSDAADALAGMKSADPDFSVSEFLQGARGAYEMILMAFEKGDMESVKPFLAEDVYESFDEVVREREAQGLTIEAEFVGVREVSVVDATFDTSSRLGEVTVRLVGELTSVVKNAEGEVIEGSPTEVRRQKDVWTFARVMGSDDPNWQLVATGE